jgi:hypothetical protein
VNAHQFIFGDRFEECVVYIINEACKKNTREAFKEAKTRIDGIRLLLHWMSGSGGVPMPTAFLLLRNEMNNLDRIIESPDGCLPKKGSQ